MKSEPQRQDHVIRLIHSIPLWFLLTVVLFSFAIVVRFVSLDQDQQIQSEFSVLAVEFLAGILVSFVFYFFVVHLPESRRRNLIKENLRANYLYLKRGILLQVIHGSIAGGRRDLDSSFDLCEKLMNVENFREAFSKGRQAHEGYYAFSNHLSEDTPQFQEILVRLAQLKSQIGLLLHNFPFSDLALLERFCFIELRLSRLERSTPGYDSAKPLLAFIFEIFSGWDMIEGYRGKDYILEAIEAL